MPPQFFMILGKTGSIGAGEFKEIDWHKQEGENILKAVGISVEYGEPIKKGEYRGTHNTVGDKEHAEMIKLYMEEGLSMNRIAEKLERSSRIPFTIIHKHNARVEGSGFCPAC